MYVMLHITLIIMNDMYKLCIMVLVVQFIKILLNKKEYIIKGNRKIFLYFSQKKFYYAKIEGVK